MQAFADLIGTIANTFTRSIWIVILGGIVVVAIVSALIGYTTPAVVEEVGARAERISAKAIEAAREESRAHALAKDGWGYSNAASEPSNPGAADFAEGRGGDDWGADSE